MNARQTAWRHVIPMMWLFLVGFAGAPRAQAHAFLEHAEPAVGATIKAAPVEVRIRFTEAVEAGFSSLKVYDAGGKQIDKKDAHVDPKDRQSFVVSLLPLPGGGTYKVVWRAVSVDTHVTSGDFTFRVEP